MNNEIPTVTIRSEVTGLDFEQECVGLRELTLSYLASLRMRFNEQAIDFKTSSLPVENGGTRSLHITSSAEGMFCLELGPYEDSPEGSATYEYTEVQLTLVTEGEPVRLGDDVDGYSHWQTIKDALYDCDRQAFRADKSS